MKLRDFRFKRGILFAGIMSLLMGIVIILFPSNSGGPLRLLHAPGLVVSFTMLFLSYTSGIDAVNLVNLLFYGCIGFVLGGVFKRLRTAAIVCGACVGLLLAGAVAFDAFWPGSEPGWVNVIPPDCQIVKKRFTTECNSLTLFEGPMCYIRIRSSRPARAVLEDISRNLSRQRFVEAKPRTWNDQDGEQRQYFPNWLRTALIQRSPAADNLVIVQGDGTTTITCFGWTCDNGSEVEMFDNIGL